jgi:hypothetical protein
MESEWTPTVTDTVNLATFWAHALQKKGVNSVLDEQGPVGIFSYDFQSLSGEERVTGSQATR